MILLNVACAEEVLRSGQVTGVHDGSRITVDDCVKCGYHRVQTLQVSKTVWSSCHVGNYWTAERGCEE